MTTLLEEKWESKALDRPRPLFPAFGSPFLRRAMEDMERAFEDLNFGFGLKMPKFEEPIWTPKIDVFEKNGRFVVRAELPGMKKEDVKVEITDEALTLEGERKLEEEEKGQEYYRIERSHGRFYRSIPLPKGTIFEKANAVFKDGVLEVTIPIPKTEGRKARRLEITGY